MCGRYTLATPAPDELRGRFGLDERVHVRTRFNVAPGDDVLAVTTDRHGAPRGDSLRWGLVPHWARDPRALGLKLINARAETVATRAAFRDAFSARRCLIVADGFYEWERRPDGSRQAWWVTRDDGAPYAFAGVWAGWRPEDAGDIEPLRTCAIVTAPASPALAGLHDRMPVILPAEAEASWLAPDTPQAALLELCAPFAATAARAVGPAVNDARYDGPDCLAPAEQPLTLF